jgi:hypothetical protein
MKVDHSIHDEWLQWQLTEHIPAIMATGQFIEYKFYRLLDIDEEDGNTYVVQYIAATIHDYDKYLQEYAPSLRHKAQAKWGNRFLTFRTVMKAVQ